MNKSEALLPITFKWVLQFSTTLNTSLTCHEKQGKTLAIQSLCFASLQVG